MRKQHNLDDDQRLTFAEKLLRDYGLPVHPDCATAFAGIFGGLNTILSIHPLHMPSVSFQEDDFQALAGDLAAVIEDGQYAHQALDRALPNLMHAPELAH
jgi:hypothetical protein